MNFKYQNLLIFNQVPDVTIGNRLHCRFYGWFVACSLRPRGSSTTTTTRRPIVRRTARTTVRTTCRTMTWTIPSSVLRCSGRVAPGDKSFANLWDKVYKHFSDVKKSSGFLFVPFLYPRRGDVTCLGVMKKSYAPTNTLRREHLGW